MTTPDRRLRRAIVAMGVRAAEAGMPITWVDESVFLDDEDRAAWRRGWLARRREIVGLRIVR